MGFPNTSKNYVINEGILILNDVMTPTIYDKFRSIFIYIVDFSFTNIEFPIHYIPKILIYFKHRWFIVIFIYLINLLKLYKYIKIL
jgi:hypothetical protein